MPSLPDRRKAVPPNDLPRSAAGLFYALRLEWLQTREQRCSHLSPLPPDLAFAGARGHPLRLGAKQAMRPHWLGLSAPLRLIIPLVVLDYPPNYECETDWYH